MNASNFDVVIVGCGAAGVTAAIGLARAGFSVAVVEAARFPGAENWSGCVYFCENLAHPEILGPEGVEQLAWERRLVERGFFATDGYGLLGMKYRDPSAFRHCYTVLRPIYDHHLAQVALRQGVALLNATTAESLIREDGRIVGVCTQRGPLYANLVFLAEGDASHLVTREGYERSTDQRATPKFLQGIKEVIDLPPGAIEERFGVGAQEGIAYEMLVRNGTLRGKPVHLNMGGFIYANRQSLSVGLVLPADNLHQHFEGDPNLLIEWFEGLPALEPWLRQGKRSVFGAKLIRGGGIKDVPTLIDHGLAIGGAASAIGIDFPYPNFTGPATAMGLLLVQAAQRIRQSGGDFSREQLQRHYLEPLQQTAYWQDVDFLRRWPGYIKRTQVFFDTNIDLGLGAAYVWTRPNASLLRKWANWVRLVREAGGPSRWADLRQDVKHLARALRFRDIADRPSLGRFVLDGTVNALRDLFRQPRANLPEAGQLRVHYTIAGGKEPVGTVPRPLQRWFNRAAPVLSAAARRVYSNDQVPLWDKLPSTIRLLVRQVNMLDLLGCMAVGSATALSGGIAAAWQRLASTWRNGPRPSAPSTYQNYLATARQVGDMTPSVPRAAQHWEARLAQLSYDTVKASHIHVLWPQSLPTKNEVVHQGLWHVCPAHVYEARTSPLGQLQIIVNYENCIKCETCWRTSDIVDWGRDGAQRFVYPVHSPAIEPLIEMQAATTAPVVTPRSTTYWLAELRATANSRAEVVAGNGQQTPDPSVLIPVLDQLEQKLIEFDDALAEEPRLIDRSRAEYLEMLARYAQQLAERAVELLDGGTPGNPTAQPDQRLAFLQTLAAALLNKAQERARRTWSQRYAWAASAGRQMRYHHLVGVRQALESWATPSSAVPVPQARERRRWGEAPFELAPAEAATLERLDEVVPLTIWRDLEHTGQLSASQDEFLRNLIAHVPAIDPQHLEATLHLPLRKRLLAELGRRDPSLAFRVASHLWARDLQALLTSPSLNTPALNGDATPHWTCLAIPSPVPGGSASATLDAGYVPAQGCDEIVLLAGDQLVRLPRETPGLTIEPLPTLGLRGAGLARVQWNGALPPSAPRIDPERAQRIWEVLSAADLTSIALGMADQLCLRSIAHATSRVQFPGLFLDEDARDSIGKFGIVKKMVADMAARRLIIATLDATRTPINFSAESRKQALLSKAVAAELLGTSPGSISYNAGQVFGGTGYSEDDILSKFYRDAAAWRYLGVPNPAIYEEHGRDLLQLWSSGKQQLTELPEEAELLEQVIQRKALQGELDQVRNLRSRLKSLIGEWQAATPSDSPGRSDRTEWRIAAQAEVWQGLARQDAHLVATKALLLRTHAHLEAGIPSETDLALIRVWLDAMTFGVDEYETTVRSWLDQVGLHESRPVIELTSDGPLTDYGQYLATPAPYESGDFLGAALDLGSPRLIPDMVQSDPTLARGQRFYHDLLAQYFGTPRNGRLYERYVERQHRPDAADLEFCREHGFFRMPIPQELGGEGARKVDYYLLTTNAQRLADVSISLSIQANTSIGTTPVLLARDKDLPKAIKEVDGFLKDTSLQQAIEKHWEELQRTLQRGDSKGAEHALAALNERLQPVLSRSALKAPVAPFASAWKKLKQASLSDLGARALAGKAQQAWSAAVREIQQFRIELQRRVEACDLFLQWVACGQISAFALTEPSAGSDTARVGTRARLRSVPVDVESDGVLSFVPEGSTERRFLLDSKRLVFKDRVAYYQWSVEAPPAPIRFDEYDYETDDPRGMQYYDHGTRRVHFTDIAELRQRDGRFWYDYWELTGAKMWITNGRISGIMVLYAKTDAGVTGFIVDRHAEGLIVGKDEEKMGQCGSPTNELSLQAVRVPRENVLGLEGRGQVNALETLNVGRAGLAMSAMAQMSGLIETGRTFALKTYGAIPAWVQWRLQRMQEIRFTAEALAFEVIGRFEHPGTRSIRMESAISKMIVTEMLHQVIEFAEDILGVQGQTQDYLVEKRKRDARILNIYEGTNEIQRFLILKDLDAEVAPRWAQTRTPSSHFSREAVELENLKEAFRQRTRAAIDLFHENLWQDPNLQANCFLLAEAAAWIKAAESSLAREAWLTQREFGTSAPAAATTAEADGSASRSVTNTEDSFRSVATPVSFIAAGVGRRAVARCYAEIRSRLRHFDEELTHLRRGYYAPSVRAASLLFRNQGHAETSWIPESRITQPLSILVVLEVLNPFVPVPHVVAGRLMEADFTWSQADESALETALRLRDAASAPVRIEVIAVGRADAADRLRELLSLGIERVRLLVPNGSWVAPQSAAAAIAGVLDDRRFDLVLTGSEGPGDEAGMVGRLAAWLRGVAEAGAATQISVEATESSARLRLYEAGDRRGQGRSLPACVLLRPGLPLRPFTTAGYLEGLTKQVEVVRWPQQVALRRVEFLASSATDQQATAEESPRPLSPGEAAAQIVHQLGLSGGGSADAAYGGRIETVNSPGAVLGTQVGGPTTRVLLASDAEGRLHPHAAATIRAAEVVAGQGGTCQVVLLTTLEESVQRRAVGQLQELGDCQDVLLIASPIAVASPEVQARFLAECWPQLSAQPHQIVAEPWATAALVRLSAQVSPSPVLVLGVRQLERENDGLVARTSRAGGKLQVRQKLPLNTAQPCWITISDQFESERRTATTQTGEPRVFLWAPTPQRGPLQAEMEQLLAEVRQEAGVSRLSDADFIVDVGFGIGNRDGFEAVIDPLVAALQRIGVHKVVVGGSRKVTEEMHLLPVDRQIGQSGVSVNPQILLAIGVSGAPQHLNYIGPRATILAFNRDPEAPIMVLNRTQQRPRVFPIVGNLFETVPALTAALNAESSAEQHSNGHPDGAGALPKTMTTAAHPG